MANVIDDTKILANKSTVMQFCIKIMQLFTNYNNNIPNEISQVGSGKVEHTQTLPLPRDNKISIYALSGYVKKKTSSTNPH